MRLECARARSARTVFMNEPGAAIMNGIRSTFKSGRTHDARSSSSRAACLLARAHVLLRLRCFQHFQLVLVRKKLEKNKTCYPPLQFRLHVDVKI